MPCHEDTVEVRFGGRVEPHWDAYGHYHGELRGYESVLAVPRDMLIAPYGDGRVNTLRLWEAHSPNDLDMYLFAAGSYVQSLEQRTMAEVITKVLYPADDHIEGKTLRITVKEGIEYMPASVMQTLYECKVGITPAAR